VNKLFENRNINSGRQIELDIARGLAVLFMIAVHILEVFSNEQVTSSLYGSIIGFLGGPPAAPVFMFLLGAGIIYSSKSEPYILLKRGIIIFLGGYLLNFLRGTMPNLIGYVFTSENELFDQSIIELISVDILQFAGLTLIYFSIIKKLKSNLVVVLITGVVFCLVNLLLSSIKIENLFLSTFTTLIWGSGKTSYFPFLSWIIYPIAGYTFGSFLIRCSNKLKFYLILFFTGLISFLGSGFLTVGLFNIDIGLLDEYSYYHHNILGNIVFLSFVLTWVSFLFFISKWFFGVLKTTIERWSRNVTSIYFIHWILIGNIVIFVGMNNSNLFFPVML
jgi:uncharacterized membrane protein